MKNLTSQEIDEFLELEKLGRYLTYRGYDKLGLASLDRLRNEIYIRLEQLKLKE